VTQWKNVDRFTGPLHRERAELRTTNYSIGAATELGKKKRLSLGFGGNLIYTRSILVNRHFIAAPGGGGGQLEVANFDLTSKVSPGYGWNGRAALGAGQVEVRRHLSRPRRDPHQRRRHHHAVFDRRSAGGRRGRGPRSRRISRRAR
jgi:hypothetical protein